MNVRAGSLIDMEPPLDTWHLFTSTKCPWYQIPSAAKQYPSVGEGFEDQDPKLPNLERYTAEGVIAGSCLDSEPGVTPLGHIFVGSKARWFTIEDSLAQWTEDRMVRHIT